MSSGSTSGVAGLASELRPAVMRLGRRLRNEHDPDNELSVGELSVLGALFRQGERTVGSLAAHERVRPPSMTRTINALAEGGFVCRRAHETDKRQVLVSLTDKGRQTLAADRRRRDAWLSVQLRGFTAQERALLRDAVPLLERMATA